MKRNRMLRNFFAFLAITIIAIPALAKDDAMSLVPANAATVGMVKLAEMRSSPLSSILFQHTDNMSADGDAARFLADAGLAPLKDVDVIVVATAPRTALGSDADVLVLAEGRFDVDRLTAALVERGAVQKSGYLILPDQKSEGEKGAVAFPSSSLAVAGTEQAVAAALSARADGGTGFTKRGGLALDLGRIDPAATAWAIVDVQRAARLTKAGNIQTGGASGETLQAAFRTMSTIAIWAVDTGEALKLGAVGLSSDGETLQLLEDTIRGALSGLRLAAREKSPDMVSVIRRFDVSRKNNAVMIQGSIPASTLRTMMAKKTASATK